MTSIGLTPRPPAPVMAVMAALFAGCAEPSATDPLGSDSTAGSSSSGFGSGTDTDAGSGETSGESSDGSEDSGAELPPAGDSTGASEVCGDGIVDPGEVCDDGVNNGAYGGCEPSCMVASAHCGGGSVDAPVEACDDGVNDGAYGGCMPGCTTLAAFCGDGHRDPEESCDDANGAINDGCNPDCTAPGERLWGHAWSPGAIPADADSLTYDAAGVTATPSGDIQIAYTENVAYGNSIWNIRIDSGDGSLKSADSQQPMGSVAFTANSAVGQGEGAVIVGRSADYSGYPYEYEAAIYRTDADGEISSNWYISFLDEFYGVVADPESDRIAVIEGNTVLGFSSTAMTFEYEPFQQLMDPHSIAWGVGGLFVAGENEVFGGLSVNELDESGEVVGEGFWNGLPDAIGFYAASTTATSDGGVLIAGRWSWAGGVFRSFVLKMDDSLTHEWSAYETIDSPPDEWWSSCESPNGDVWLLGTVVADSAEGPQDRVRKLSPDGEVMVSMLLEDPEKRRRKLDCLPDGGAVLAGSTGTLEMVGDTYLINAWYERLAP